MIKNGPIIVYIYQIKEIMTKKREIFKVTFN